MYLVTTLKGMDKNVGVCISTHHTLYWSSGFWSYCVQRPTCNASHGWSYTLVLLFVTVTARAMTTNPGNCQDLDHTLAAVAPEQVWGNLVSFLHELRKPQEHLGGKKNNQSVDAPGCSSDGPVCSSTISSTHNLISVVKVLQRLEVGSCGME